MGDINNRCGRSTYLTLKQINSFRMLLKFSNFIRERGSKEIEQQIIDAEFLFGIKEEKETLEAMMKKFDLLEQRILENQNEHKKNPQPQSGSPDCGPAGKISWIDIVNGTVGD